ncbi:MAG: ABC transporter permease [Thermoanaerobaculia bacterium]
MTLVILYWFVFTFLIPQGPGSRNHGYIVFLISGLVPWIGFSEGITRATTSIVDNATIVRRLPFRSEVLVVVPNVSAILFELIALILFFLFLAATRPLSPLLWVLPFAIVLQFALQVGAGWILSTLFVFFRDLAQILGFVLSIVFYLSPILYPVSGRFKTVLGWNPLTPLLGLFRSAMTGAPLPSAGSIVFLMVVTAGMCAAGLTFFRRTQATITDLV